MKSSHAIRIGFAVAVFAAIAIGGVSIGIGVAQGKTVQAAVPLRMGFVHLNGLFRHLIGLRACNGCVRLLGSGQLMRPSPVRADMAVPVANMLRFAESCATNGARFLYVQLPKKLDVGRSMLPPDVSDFAYDNADVLVGRLVASGIPFADWRARFAGTPRAVSANFYRTDAHWNNETSLAAARLLALEIARRCGVAEDEAGRALRMLDGASWSRTVVTNCFCGNLGVRTGRFFAGKDDVCVLMPTFATHIAVQVPSRSVDACGSFGEAVVPVYSRLLRSGRKRLQRPFGGQYVGGNACYVRFSNPNAPMDVRIMLIGDSFMRSVRAYLSTVVREIVSFDPRHCETAWRASDAVRRHRPDIVIQAQTAAALTADAAVSAKRGCAVTFEYGL